MPLYFFDTFANDKRAVDDVGTEVADLAQARREAMHVLPAIAKDEVAKDGDRQAFTVLIRDQADRPVYSATLTFAGLWLGPDAPAT